uniref:Uncharacterized protein n=1 Tax=Tanacetum cinerariifolium TaxID=118510 RepID=A0A6L2MQY2_TANCI|nr:hypothetical protein [Tanacetum cinerariifolium]
MIGFSALSSNESDEVDIDSMTIAEYKLHIAKQGLKKNPLNDHSYSFTSNPQPVDKELSFEKDVERLRQLLTPTVHALPEPNLVVQPYVLLIPYPDEVKVVRQEELDNDIDSIPTQEPDVNDDLIQPLIPQTVHTMPPYDAYVVTDTKPILEELLEEFEDEILYITLVDEEADFNPIRDIKELKLLIDIDHESSFTKIKAFLCIITTNVEFEPFIQQLNPLPSVSQSLKSSTKMGKKRREMTSPLWLLQPRDGRMDIYSGSWMDISGCWADIYGSSRDISGCWSDIYSGPVQIYSGASQIYSGSWMDIFARWTDITGSCLDISGRNGNSGITIEEYMFSLKLKRLLETAKFITEKLLSTGNDDDDEIGIKQSSENISIEPSCNMPRNERHKWLRFDTQGYTEEEQLDFKTPVRGQAPELVNTTDFFFLRSMDEGTMMLGGQFIAQLGIHFRVITEQSLHTLTTKVLELPTINLEELIRLRICKRLMDTIVWVVVCPQRHQVEAMGKAAEIDPEAPQDAHVGQEDVQADLAPQMPQEAIPASRNIAQRLHKVKEKVHQLSKGLRDQHVMIEGFVSEQARYSAWMVDRMIEFIEQRGLRYQRV